MANVFNGKLELISANQVPGQSTLWDIVANFTDALGVFYANDVMVGDIIYNDGTSINLGLLRYSIVIVDGRTTFSKLYARVTWDFTGNDINEPLCGFEAFIGRALLGTVYLPSTTVQLVSEGFIQYARNVEAWMLAKYSYINRAFNGSYTGVRDGKNTVFTLMDDVLPGTMVFEYNGIEQQLGIDYTICNNIITVRLPPNPQDKLTFDYNRA